MKMDDAGSGLSQMFWGLPLRLLVFPAEFLPRVMGGSLIANGLAYVVMAFTALPLPQHVASVTTIASSPLFGEVALALWLLAVGAKERQPVATATA